MTQTDAFLDELVRVSADLDRLIADRQSGVRPSQTRHDGHVDRAEKLDAVCPTSDRADAPLMLDHVKIRGVLKLLFGHDPP